MTKELPWIGCDHPWNTENCFERTSLSHNDSIDIETETIVITVGPNTTENVVTFFESLTGNWTEENKLVRATEEFWTYVFYF